MSIKGSTIFRRKSGLTIELRSVDSVIVRLGDTIHSGNRNTMAILDAFSDYRSLQSAIDSLQIKMRGISSFSQITDQILALIKLGFLVELGVEPTHVDSHPARFDSFPVHVRMLNDEARTRAFQQAIRQTTSSGDVFLDIGTGTGILATTAALAGAKHVYAIERTRMADIARAVFQANGVENCVTIIHGDSSHVDLPERADIVVAELIGNDPLAEGIVHVFRDAVARLAKPSVRLIPSRMRLYALPVTIPIEVLREKVVTRNGVTKWKLDYEVDLTPLLEAVKDEDQWFFVSAHEASDWPRVAPPILLAEIDLSNVESNDIRTSNTFKIDASGELNGVLLFFSLLLGQGEWFSISPDLANESSSWLSPVFFSSKPLSVSVGQTFKIEYAFESRENKSNIRVYLASQNSD